LNGLSTYGLRTAPIFTRFVNICWSLFTWCLFLGVLGAVAIGGYLYIHLNDEIRRQVERRLADYYRDFDVHVGSARFDADQGIAISDLAISAKGHSIQAEPVLTVEEMYLAGKVRMDQLVTGQLPIDDVNVRGAKLHVVHEIDGRWNSAALLPLPHFGEKAPRIKIDNALATLEDATVPGTKPFSINDVTLQLTPSPSSTAANGAAVALHVDGTTTSLPARSVRLAGELNCTGGGFNVEIKADGLELSSEILANLPGTWAEKLHSVEFGGRADFVLNVNRATRDEALNWSATYKVDHGQLSHPSLPDRFTEVSLDGSADGTQLRVEHFNAKWGSATLVAAMNRAGWSDGAPLGLAATVVGLEVSDRMRAGLPDAARRVWDRFKPRGQADATVRIRYDGQMWRPDVVVKCRNLSLTDAERFAYPLEQTTGQIEYHSAENGVSDRLRFDLSGVGAGRPIKVEADLRDVVRAEADGLTTGAGIASHETTGSSGGYRVGFRGIRPTSTSHPVGFIKVSGTDVPIHEQLLAAIPDRAQSFTRSLEPQGLIDFQFCSVWKDASQSRPNVTLDLALKDCRIQFDKFSYPLQRVRGSVKANNWHWTLSDLEARGVNDSTVVKCRGTATPNSGGYDADLYFDATDVPLDDPLKASLPAGAQKAWSDLRPQGRIDFHAHATKQADATEPEIEVTLQPREKSVSIEPIMFPYRLEQVAGQVVYQRGRAELHNIVALHDRTVYSAESGVWQATPDRSWQISLSKLNADRLVLSRDLLAALPPELQSAIDRFQPSGTFVLINSNVNLSKQAQVGVSAAWDVNLVCQQASIQTSPPLRGITGEVHLVGQSNGGNAVTAGELGVDSLIVKDTQLTNVRGPFWTDGSRVLIGEPACVQEGQALRRLTADAYGGRLVANVELLRAANPSFKLDVQLGGVSLGRFANERLGGPNDMGGTVSGKLVLSGTGQTAQTLRGGGEMHVVDGHIYQMPPLVSLLSVLKNKTPDTTAFNRCDMQFEVQGEHVQFQHLNLLGDAVSLYGSGEADFNRKLDLEFFTLLAPADLPIPFLKTIAGRVSQQALQLKVVGTFDDPKVERKALPAVNDVMERIQNGLQEGASSVSPDSATRSARSSVK
jgi:hypothetical protein